jgi:hypothetical protein
MALNGKLLSLKSIVSDLYGDLALDDSDNVEDFVRWTVDALNLVGHPMQYRRRVTGHGEIANLKITDYKAPLPCNLHSIEQISVNGYMATYNSNSFHHLLSGECCGLDNTTPSVNSAITDGFYIDGFGNEFVAGSLCSLGSCGITYDVNADCLTLSVKEGEVCIAYNEFPFDDEGYPMIPDNVSYIEAVKKYITMKMDYRNWRKAPSSQGKRMLYEDSKQEWAWYVGQASNAAKMPSLDQMESIKNSLLRTVKSYNHHASGFKHLGDQQRRRIH